VKIIPDRQMLMDQLHALGYKARGGVDKAATDRDEEDGHSFPHFSSSFSTGGVTYPFTMVGHKPQTGLSTSIKTVIIPLRMNFVFFGARGNVSHSFDPASAVANMIHSPLYAPAVFPNGFTGRHICLSPNRR